MPLFNPVTYATQIGVIDPSNEYIYLQGFLMFIEGYLLNNYSLEFSTDESAKQREGSDTGINIIPAYFVRDISIITKKSYKDSSYSKALLLHQDYILDKVKTAPKPIYQIRLTSEQLKHPFYLDITGKWSFADDVPFDILGAVLEVLQLGLANFRYNKDLLNKSGKSIKSTKIGNVDVSFGGGNSSRDTSYSSLIESSSLKIILESNYTI
jgi:hypothetical protein